MKQTVTANTGPGAAESPGAADLPGQQLRRPPTDSAILIDSHVHTDDPRLAADRGEILHRAREAGVVAQIVPAISQRHWPRLRQLCDAEADLYACYGLHPCFMQEHENSHLDELPTWLELPGVVAVGECGLDYRAADTDRMRQQEIFKAQLSLARQFRLPIVIHALRAVEDVINLIRESGHHRGLVHSFNGSAEQARRLIDLGFHLSFGGAVTHERARKLRKLVASLPLDAILLETDAPDQTGAAHAGQRNEPAFLREIWQDISALRTEDANTMARATTRNAIELFDLPLSGL